jgi:hypothetical protein
MSVINRSPINTTAGAGYRYWQDEDFSRFSTEFLSEGVIMHVDGNALHISEKGAVADMSVDVAAGMCIVEITRNGRTHKVYVENTASANLAISSNASGSTRYDLVCVKVDTAIDPDTQADNMSSLIIVEGTPGAGVPATPSNYLKLAEVEVINGAVTIPNAKIVDRRIPVTYVGFIDPSLATHGYYIQTPIDRSEYVNNTNISGAASVLTKLGNTVDYFAGNLAGDYCNVKMDILYPSGSTGLLMFADTVAFASVSDKDIFVGLANFTAAAIVPANATSVTRHIGFFVEDTTLYASNADGANQVKTAIGTVSVFPFNFRFEVDPNTPQIRFYVNNALVATHTQYIYTAAPLDYYCGITSQIAGTVEMVQYGEPYISHRYYGVGSIGLTF